MRETKRDRESMSTNFFYNVEQVDTKNTPKDTQSLKERAYRSESQSLRDRERGEREGSLCSFQQCIAVEECALENAPV